MARDRRNKKKMGKRGGGGNRTKKLEKLMERKTTDEM